MMVDQKQRYTLRPCNIHWCCPDSLLNNLIITKTTKCHRLSWAVPKGCRYSEISRLSSSVLCSVRSRLWSFLNCLTGLHLPGRTLHYLTCLQKARVWHICEVSWIRIPDSSLRTEHLHVNKIWWARVPDWWILKLRAEKWRECSPSRFFVDPPVSDLAYLAWLPLPRPQISSKSSAAPRLPLHAVYMILKFSKQTLPINPLNEQLQL